MAWRELTDPKGSAPGGLARPRTRQRWFPERREHSRALGELRTREARSGGLWEVSGESVSTTVNQNRMPREGKNDNVSACLCVRELETCPELSDRKVIT